MKSEQSEKLLISELFNHSKAKCKLKCGEIVDIERLTGDASTRRYYRIVTSPDTFVVCLDNPSEKNSFVDLQSFFEDKGVRVPRILDCDLSKGYILEEDLGDNTLLTQLAHVDGVEEEYDYYKRSIDELVKIHKISHKSLKNSNIGPLAFDFKKLSSEIDFTINYFLEKFLDETDPKIIEEIKSQFYKICLRLSEVERVCTHRDFHSRNIMVKNGELVVIDFQDARMGAPQYDLASLLDDCYYNVNDGNKEKLTKYYFSEMSLSGTYEEFLDVYADMALQRVFKAIGSFSYIYHYRKDYRYLKYMGFAMEKLKLILMKNKKYDRLRKSLMSLYYAK